MHLIDHYCGQHFEGGQCHMLSIKSAVNPVTLLLNIATIAFIRFFVKTGKDMVADGIDRQS